jgi:hypothetical protein
VRVEWLDRLPTSIDGVVVMNEDWMIALAIARRRGACERGVVAVGISWMSPNAR